MQRYDRQMLLPQLGAKGQQALGSARVLVIGAGGLGCPVLQYLAAAGVGTIGIVDGDTVSLTNLHRQVLYDMSDIGQQKAGLASAKLQRMNPDITIISYSETLTNKNAWEILEIYDIVVDASDNFPTRYLVNDACVLLGKPVVYGAVSRFEGQVAVFNVQRSGADRTMNYRDLFPQAPVSGEIANCAEAGVMGVLPGIIGTLQAGEVIRLITEFGQPQENRLISFNLLTNEWHQWEIQADPDSQNFLPRDKAAFLQAEYELTCIPSSVTELEPAEFDELVKENQATVIDVRELTEQPFIDEFDHVKIPLAQLKDSLASLKDDILVTLCQSGARSRRAAQLLATSLPRKRIYSLKGGIAGYKQQQLKVHA